MKKIVSFVLGLFITTALQAANTEVARITITGAGGPEASDVTLRVDPSISAVQTSSFVGETEEVGQINMYASYNDEKLSSFKANAISNLPIVLVTNRRDAQYTLTFSVPTSTDGLTLTDLRSEDGLKTINIADGESYTFSVANEANYAANTNVTIADRFVINYVAPAPACVTVRENLEVGRYYTICLPQDIVSFNGGTFWSMSKRGVGVAYLEGEDAPLNAGQPYIFQATAEELCVVYGNAVPAAEAGAAGALKGTFAAMGQAALSDAATTYGSPIYLLYHNELRPAAGAGNNLPANRAFIVYNLLDESEPNPAPGRRVRAIPMQTNGATGFENVDVEAAKAVKFMEDGKIFIKRGDAIYNLQGQLVK